MEQELHETCRYNRVAESLKSATIEELEAEFRRRIEISLKTLSLAESMQIKP